MAYWRILLSAVSLSTTMLLWPSSSPAGPKSCAELMTDIYKRVQLLDLMDNSTNQAAKASTSRKTHDYISDTLPAFKATCPGPEEARSIEDLENGRYLSKLAAEREKRRKAHRHIKTSGGFTGEDRGDGNLEDLEIQR